MVKADAAPSPQKRLPRWLWVLLAIALVSFGLVRWRSASAPNLKDADTAALTQPVTANTLTVRVDGSGTVVSVDTVNLSPKTTGRLETLSVEQGDAVQTGQILARMDVGSLPAELAQAQAQQAQAQADYDRVRAGNRPEAIRRAAAQVTAAESRLVLASNQLARYQDLASQGAIAQNELDQYVNEVNTAAANLKEAQEQLDETTSGSRSEDVAAAAAAVDAARARVAIIETQLDDANIRAPFGGIVTQTYATVGAIVTPTTTASATASATSSSILALSSGLEVQVDVTEASIGQIQEGQSVDILVDAFTNQTFKGKVVRIAPEAVIENNVTTFQVVVELLTGLDQLRSGMTVDAVFVGDTVTDALMVPTVAIATEAGQMGVRVPDDQGDPIFRPVTVGLTQTGQTQILSGLEAGDRVFLDLPPTDVPLSLP